MPQPPKKRKPWDVDPSIFELRRKVSFYGQRVAPILWQRAKFGLYALAITYPLYLVYVGLALGGLIFWSFFVGSFVVMGTTISRLGFASNFRHWNVSVKRAVGVLLSFVIAAGFYGRLIYLKFRLVPIAVRLAGLGILLVTRRTKL